MEISTILHLLSILIGVSCGLFAYYVTKYKNKENLEIQGDITFLWMSVATIVCGTLLMVEKKYVKCLIWVYLFMTLPILVCACIAKDGKSERLNFFASVSKGVVIGFFLYGIIGTFIEDNKKNDVYSRAFIILFRYFLSSLK